MAFFTPRSSLPQYWLDRIRAWSTSDWQLYAANRLSSLLKTHCVCSTREMEARLCDFGSNLIPRVEPHHLTTARSMLKLKVVSQSPIPLYSLPDTPLQSIENIISRKEFFYMMHSLIVSQVKNFVVKPQKKLFLLACQRH